MLPDCDIRQGIYPPDITQNYKTIKFHSRPDLQEYYTLNINISIQNKSNFSQYVIAYQKVPRLWLEIQNFKGVVFGIFHILCIADTSIQQSEKLANGIIIGHNMGMYRPN